MEWNTYSSYAVDDWAVDLSRYVYYRAPEAKKVEQYDC